MGFERHAIAGIALALLLVPMSASARWYQVEVVAFRHLEGAAAAGEQWPELMALPEFGRAVKLITELPEMSDEPPDLADAAGGASAPLAFELLPVADRRLAGVERSLKNSAGYRPLISAAWRQPSFGIARAKWVYLSDVPAPRRVAIEGGGASFGAEVVPRVEGVVRIKVSRLLHIDVDFLYYHEGTPVRLQETRKLKLREIHYFDHPLFGLVVQVSPFVIPQAAESGDEEPDDPGGDE